MEQKELTGVVIKPVYKKGAFRRLYEWVLSWADSRYGTLALFLLAFAEASFFPIPPDVLLIALSLARPRKAWWYAFICLLGSVTGGILGYIIGSGFYEVLGEPIINFFHYQEQFAAIGNIYAANAFWFIFAAALTPIPYKVFTIAAGVWNVNLLTLIIVSIFGRGLRFFAVAALIFFFGKPIKKFIDKYFNLLSILFLVLLILGFVIIKYLI